MRAELSKSRRSRLECRKSLSIFPLLDLTKLKVKFREARGYARKARNPDAKQTLARTADVG